MTLRTLKDRAHALDRAGKHDKASRVYAELCAQAPQDPFLRLRHADACRKAGDLSAAIGSYLSAARQMYAAGQVARARAVVRAAHQLSPSNRDVSRALDGLERRLKPASTIREAVKAAAEIELGDEDVEVCAEEPLEIDVGPALPLVEESLVSEDAFDARLQAAASDDLVWIGSDRLCVQLASGAWVTLSSDSPIQVQPARPPSPTPAFALRGPRDTDA